MIDMEALDALKTKLNSQGLSRDEPLLMECLVSDLGHVTVSVDLSAGEPTCTSHFSGDKLYNYANFGGVGQRPYYNDRKILMLSDVYFMVASVSPTGAKKMEDIFHNTYNGVSFAEQWLIDDEVLKSHPDIKPVRKFHKILALALQYGLSPAGVLSHARDVGVPITKKDAEYFYKAYWFILFPDVRKLGERLKQYRKRLGYIETIFGHRMYPPVRKCLNYFIQSHVSGIIDVLAIKFYDGFPAARHKAIIHDELVFDVPENRVDEAKEVMLAAVASLNKDLKWKVKIRTGWAVGKNWSEAH